MKKTLLTLVVLCGFVLLAGCGQEAAPPVDDAPVTELPAAEERLNEIIDAAVPERDPFDSGPLAMERERRSATVEQSGRDPFAMAAAAERTRESSRVRETGRNPFVEASQGGEQQEPEPEPPEEPVIPGEPVDVQPPGVVLVELRTTDRCWLDVFVDDVRVLRTNVPLGQTLSWEAERVVRLEQVGREFAMRATVNGKDYGTLGELARRLETGGTMVDREAGVAISLERRYAGGVLVGLAFSAVSGD